MSRFLVGVLVLGLVAIPACAPSANRQPLLIFAGSASKQPVDEAAAAFQKRTGIPVTVTYGGSGTLLSQMILAKALDFVTSADGRAIFSRNGFRTTRPGF